MDNSPGHCVRCGKKMDAFDLEESANGQCLECAVKRVDDSVAKEIEKAAPKEIPAWVKTTGLGALLLVLLIVTLKNIPAVRESFAELEPISTGISPTDSATKACIALLWKAARLLQDKMELKSVPSCPAGSHPYAVDEAGNIRVVRCPNPEEHGVSDISVSEKNPIPRVTK